MYEQRNGLVTPPDETIIWRYMDFTKFFSMVHSNALFFSSVFALKAMDPFEGAMPRSAISDYENALRATGHNESDVQGWVKSMGGFHGHMRAIFYVNCWHMSQHESAAMWKLYLTSDEGVAIRSNCRRLKDSLRGFPDPVFVSRVNYVEYKTARLPPTDFLLPVIHKRKSFEHEKELRAIHCDQSLIKPGTSSKTLTTARPGLPISVDLATLIEEIRVAPMCKPWVQELVSAVVAKYNLNKSVVRSQMESEDVW